MEILLTKTVGEEHILSCRRKDDSVTWMHVRPFFILHDICHYAVETILPLKNAFFGMIARGTNITDFDQPKEKRTIRLTDEAIFAEHFVNLLTVDYMQGRIESLVESFSSIYDEYGGSDLFRLITDEKLEDIREKHRDLMEEWNSLPETKSMTLLFEE